MIGVGVLSGYLEDVYDNEVQGDELLCIIVAALCSNKVRLVPWLRNLDHFLEENPDSITWQVTRTSIITLAWATRSATLLFLVYDYDGDGYSLNSPCTHKPKWDYSNYSYSKNRNT